MDFVYYLSVYRPARYLQSANTETDGGGVRGLSTLLIIKALMAKVNAERRKEGLSSVKPCELFDLIGGTSTGG